MGEKRISWRLEIIVSITIRMRFETEINGWRY